ncbi:MAG: diguanylate cyclase [Actinomycetota bacterium]|nr:diguanylate cyclase [Actinomycetota bacterium]
MEPIRMPGVLQAYGALLVVDTATRLITHASENTASLLGLDPLLLLGHSAREIFDLETAETLTAILIDNDYASNPTIAVIGERSFDVIVHRVGQSVMIEFEPHELTPRKMILGTRQAMRRFADAGSMAELWDLAAAEFRQITGFDRVTVEHFHPDGHGEIVAESVEAELEPSLGLLIKAFPESMQIAAGTRSRMIVNSESSPVALLGDPDSGNPLGVDLTRTGLRAASQEHLAFMREHQMVSSFSLSLVRNKALIGLIAGGHHSERRLPYDIRDGFEVLASQVSLQLGAMHDIEQLAQRNGLRDVRAALDAQLARSGDLVRALLHEYVTILDLIPADGAAIRYGNKLDWLGTTGSSDALRHLMDRLAAVGAPADLVTSDLPRRYPELAAELPDIAGIMVRPLNREGDYLAWFRGNRPRAAFPAETIVGQSESWGTMPWHARELVRDLQATLLRQAESRLAELAIQDPLTGLPNRRLLMDRLEQELPRIAPNKSLAVLFIDLDNFKLINDVHGHSVGDDAIRHAAIAIRAAAREGDTVARLGGDEFVVLCSNVNSDDVSVVASRIIAAVSAPATDHPNWTLSASIGVTLAGNGSDPSQVLSAADSAMYRAKQAGRGRLST